MKKRIFRIALLIGLLSPFAAPSARAQGASPKLRAETIYGGDDRFDLYQLQDWRLRQLADSTVALWNAESMVLDASGASYRLSTQVYGRQENLCRSERFWDQPIGSYCSGALVGSDLVLTAGHCVWSQDICRDTKIVFGYSVARPGVYPAAVPARDVYGCKEIVGRKQDGSGEDWSLIRLDHPVAGHRPLAINRGGQIANGAPLVVIGHPRGLPTKVAGGAVVLDASPQAYFIANLDIYGGNSGSPVFSRNTGLIEGVVVRRGAQTADFVYDASGRCNVSFVCPENASACGGDESTKIGDLASLIPPLFSSQQAERVAALDAAVPALLDAARAGGATLDRQ